MDRKEAINLALTLFRQDLDRNDVVTTLMKSNIQNLLLIGTPKKPLSSMNGKKINKTIQKSVLNLKPWTLYIRL